MERFDQLVEDHLDGELLNSELREFADLMRDTPSNRARFVGQAEVAGLLANHFHTENADAVIARTMVSLPAKPGAQAVDATTHEIMATIPSAPAAIIARPLPTPHSRWRVWVLAATLLVLAAGIAMRYIAFHPGQLAGIATLRANGDVRILSALTGDQRPAGNGDETLQSLDGVELGANSSATISFWDQTTLHLTGVGTKLWMSNRQNSTGERLLSRTGNLGKHLVLESGVLTVKAAKQPANAPMIVITPQGDAEIVGTQFVLTVTAISTKLDVTEGVVRLTRAADNASVDVSADQTATVDSGELKAVPLSP